MSFLLCYTLQLCPSSQTSPTAGLPPLLPADSAFPTHTETGGGQHRLGGSNISTGTLQIIINAGLSPADLTATGYEDRLRHADVSVREDGQRHQSVHQHTAGRVQRLSHPSSSPSMALLPHGVSPRVLLRSSFTDEA